MTNRLDRRAYYIFLCATPLLVTVVVALRALRVRGVYQIIGVLLFTAIAVAVWTLGGRAIRAEAQERRQLALSGMLLLSPFAIVALFWVGLGPPWVATAAENQMRYLVLIVMATAIAAGFVTLSEALSGVGERFYSTLGLAAIILAGPLYLIWNSFAFAANFLKEHSGQVPSAISSLSVMLDLILTLGGALTYLATAAFAASLGRTEWLGRKASRAYVIFNLVALLFLIIRGVSFPDPATLSIPWYTNPGFVVGIPAVPFIMPFFLGVMLLRRAGEKDG